MRQMKILTVRPANEDEKQLIEYVMKHTGCRTASQAMLQACKSYRIMNERLQIQQDESLEDSRLRILKEENARLKKTLIEQNRRSGENIKRLSNQIREDSRKHELKTKRKEKIVKRLQKQLTDLLEQTCKLAD